MLRANQIATTTSGFKVGLMNEYRNWLHFSLFWKTCDPDFSAFDFWKSLLSICCLTSEFNQGSDLLHTPTTCLGACLLKLFKKTLFHFPRLTTIVDVNDGPLGIQLRFTLKEFKLKFLKFLASTYLGCSCLESLLFSLQRLTRVWQESNQEGGLNSRIWNHLAWFHYGQNIKRLIFHSNIYFSKVLPKVIFRELF